MKAIRRKKFWEFMGFFPKGVNPFQIDGTFKPDFVPNFIT
jgi:hypothetical protein